MERNLFQILITDRENEPTLPRLFTENVASFREHHPDHAYHRLDNAALESFLGAHFDSDTLQAYRKLRPYSFKSDLGRFALLLVHGGIYADMVMRFVRPVEVATDKRMLCFRDSPGTGLWTVSTSLMAARAGAGALKLAIELIVANVQKGYYGATCLHPTGPALLGRALAIYDRYEEIELGFFDFLTPDRNPHNLGHINGLGRVVALRMKAGRFVDLGIPGTNLYPEIWNARMAYGEPLLVAHDDARMMTLPSARHVRRTADGVVFEPNATGFIVYGPYVSLPGGRYVATYTMIPGADLGGLTIDAVAAGDLLEARRVEATEGDHIEIEFHLGHQTDGVQVRLSSDGGAKGAILGLSITPQ